MAEPMPIRANVFTTMQIPTSLPTHATLAATAVRVTFRHDVPPYHTFETAAFLPADAQRLVGAGFAVYAS